MPMPTFLWHLSLALDAPFIRRSSACIGCTSVVQQFMQCAAEIARNDDALCKSRDECRMSLTTRADVCGRAWDVGCVSWKRILVSIYLKREGTIIDQPSMNPSLRCVITPSPADATSGGRFSRQVSRHFHPCACTSMWHLHSFAQLSTSVDVCTSWGPRVDSLPFRHLHPTSVDVLASLTT
jgi:hypothetical protein